MNSSTSWIAHFRVPDFPDSQSRLERFPIALRTVKRKRGLAPGPLPTRIFRAVTGGLGGKGTGTSAALRSQSPFPHVLLCLETNHRAQRIRKPL